MFICAECKKVITGVSMISWRGLRFHGECFIKHLKENFESLKKARGL